MTAHEKYGLKTDVKSIKERMKYNGYWQVVFHSPQTNDWTTAAMELECKILYGADLSLLCSLAEKGERYEKAVKRNRDKVAQAYSMLVKSENVFAEIITEAEGVKK